MKGSYKALPSLAISDLYSEFVSVVVLVVVLNACPIMVHFFTEVLGAVWKLVVIKMFNLILPLPLQPNMLQIVADMLVHTTFFFINVCS